jgi:hypothetical protein
MGADSFEACLGQLEHCQTDEEFISVLGILPKVLTEKNQMSRVLLAIPWKFIHRAMLTKTDDYCLAIVSVTVWESFCSMPEHCANPQLQKRIPAASQLLLEPIPVETKLTILSSLVALSGSMISMKYLTIPQVLDALFAMLDSTEELITPTLVVLHNIWLRLESSRSSLSLIFLPNISQMFFKHTGVLKFKAMDFLSILLDDISGLEVTELHKIKKSIADIVQSKLSRSQRESLFTILSQMFRATGIAWLKPVLVGNGISQGQFVSLLVNITCAEIRVTLDVSSVDLDKPEECHMISIGYQILMGLVDYLTETDDALKFESNVLNSIRQSLGEVSDAILFFLVERWTLYLEKSDKAILSNDYTVRSLETFSFLCEDMEQNDKDINNLVPMIIHFLEQELIPVEKILSLLIYISNRKSTAKRFVEGNGYSKLSQLLTEDLRDILSNLSMNGINRA